MPNRRHFLLIGEASNHKIQVGDNIEILEAYQRQDLPVALANRFRINEAYENSGLSKPFVMKLAYDTKLVRASSFTGEIVLLSREEHDLMITVTSH